MASDSYFPQKFRSLTDPNYYVTQYIWSSELDNSEKWPKDLKQEPMPPFFEEEKVSFNIGKRYSSSDIKKDRRKRATNHFKKEIYPTLAKGSDEQKHFKKKYGLKSL